MLENFPYFISRANKLWRLENLYYIVTKDGKKDLFKLNRAQKHFLENYILRPDPYYRHIILKSRQLGFCLDPETRVLMADLTWKKIKDIKIGEEIVATDEFPTDGKGHGRKMRTGIVEGKVSNIRDAYKITFDDGRTVTCTSLHPWLSKKNGGTDTQWKSLVERPDLNGGVLTVGSQVRYITKPWEDSTKEDYWFGGILDGEGSFGKKEHSGGVNASQRFGKVWDRMLKYAQDEEYNFRIEQDKRLPNLDGKGKLGSKIINKLCFGRMNEIFKLIGKTRPSRFIDNKFWEGRELPGKKTSEAWSTIVSIEKLPDQEMVDLQTSTKTYIAEGFVSHNTTLINLFILDEIIFNQNKEGLVIAHTQKDATEIFNRKVKYAIRNLYTDIQDILEMDQSRSNRVQFVFPDESVSAFSVSNSGRSGTFNFLHISEFAKLCKAYPEKAREVILGTLPALSFDSYAFIESTAEGMNGDFYEMFDKSWKRRHLITPQVSKIEFFPHFYSWTWDDAEMQKIGEPIPIENMEECEINWGEYQKDNELSDIEITYYYYRYQQLGKDIDRLHQEYPTNHMEAFIGSGSNYFNLQKIYEFDTKADDDYTRYDYINGEFVENDKGDLYVYKKPEEGRRYVIGGDVAEGLQSGDYSTACVLGHDKEIKALYRGHMEPDDYSKMVQALGKWYNTALIAVEFNKDGNWVNTDMRNMGYPNIYVRTVVDDITKNETKMYGWVTNKKNRDFALGESKKHFNSTVMINCKPLLDELKTFIRNKRGRPEAASGKHDDVVMSWIIALAVLQGKQDIKEVKKTLSWHDLVFPKRLT